MIGPLQLVDKLRELGRNFWWTWQPNAVALFRELDPALWRRVDHNPTEFLKMIPWELVERRAAEMALDSRIDYAFRRLSEYMRDTDSWGKHRGLILRSRPVAYFSAEFGLHESLPIYSGGLGVQAGDHLKSASDLGIPLIGIGLLYLQGYFRQSLNGDGWQQENYLNADADLLPIESVTGRDGKPLLVAVETETGQLLARVWRVDVGRTTLLLLDSNVPGNTESDRSLTVRLYGGDARVRIRQELLLGVGGVRALQALGIHPSVLHLNEAHGAFATLEMTRSIIDANLLSFRDAVSDVCAMTAFTTHSPDSTTHDQFSAPLVAEHLGKIRDGLHLSDEDFMGLGRVDPDDPNEPFSMTVLALRMSRTAFGVSALHGKVLRRTWRALYSNVQAANVPVGHITNSVHIESWLAPQMRTLFDLHLGTDWPKRQRLMKTWERIDSIDDAEFWETKQVLKVRLINFVRNRLVAQARRRSEPDSAIDQAIGALDLNTLTIAFASQFAAHKRPGLILQDVEQLAEMVSRSDRPIQIIFAGKAHPEDRTGKELIQDIIRLTRQDRFAQRIVFVEDHDMNVMQNLVQGVDVWLNTPLRPMEACGTAGQKAVLNGTLNLSILDGWWAEAYDGFNGFAIGTGQTHAIPAVQDERDHKALIEELNNRVVPLYYHRGAVGVPSEWIARQKHAIRTLAWRFNADRMVLDYVQRAYLKEERQSYLPDDLTKNNRATVSMEDSPDSETLEVFPFPESKHDNVAEDNIRGSPSAAISAINDKQRRLDYDVFLCHTGDDRSLVRGIAKGLREFGILPWFDEWDLRPGRNWQTDVGEMIERISSAAVFFGYSGRRAWQDFDRSGLVKRFDDRNCPIIPILLPGCDGDPDLPSLRVVAKSVDFRGGIAHPHIERLIQAITARRVFISYRRLGGAPTARLIQKELTTHGYRSFLDVEDLGPMDFEARLMLEIKNAEHFIVVLSPGALDGCSKDGDWLRREIAFALSENKNVVLVLMPGFIVPPESSLPEDIRALVKRNGVEYSHTYYSACVQKLLSFVGNTSV